MKDKVTDIETGETHYEIPNGWVWTSLDRVSKDIYRYPTFYGMEHLSDGIPVIRGEHINNDGTISHDWDNYWFVSEKLSKEFPRTIVEINDLVMSVRGSVGKIGLIDKNLQNAQVSPNCLKISFYKDYFFSKFFMLYLKSIFGQSLIREMINSTTIQTIKASLFVKIRIPLPPLAEQHRIVTKMDELFTKLDAGIESLKKVQAQLKRYRQAVLKSAVEGKLTAEWRAIHKDELEPASVLLLALLKERKNKLKEKWKEPDQPDTNNLGNLPNSWTWATLSQLGELNRGKSKHRPRDAAFLYGGAYPFIQTGDIRKANGIIYHYEQTYSEEGLKQSRLWPSGTLCITIAANIADTVILGIDACFPDSIAGFFTDPSYCDIRYIELFMRTAKENLEKYAPATAQKNINIAILSKVAIPLPSTQEQKEIVEETELRLSIADKVEFIINAEIKRAERLRQSILKQAFSGKLVPQDPNDEPASVLLDRIKHEKIKQEIESKKKPINNQKQLKLYGHENKHPLKEVWGKWPGDEPIEDILETLKRISKEDNNE